MNAFENFSTHLAKIADVAFSASVLSWDQETYMPEKGAEKRGRQISTLAGIQHELATGDTMEKLLKEVLKDNELKDWQKKCITIVEEDFLKNKKYSKEFVEELSLCISRAFQKWQEAKVKKDFSVFAPELKKLVELKKSECEILGYKNHPYNTLLNEHEKGMSIEILDPLFENLKSDLKPFLQSIANSPQVDDHFFHKHYDKKKQWDFSLELLKKIGFDFNAGRQDESTHPFSINFSSEDVRLTTRINENDLSEIIWSSIHEGGHGLYEQGLSSEFYGLPISQACSLGIHESQSRIWENNIGRSFVFWKGFFPELQKYFPENLNSISVENFFRGMNKVQASLIRTNADELTYHFHVIIRYEIEKELIEGSIHVEDLPKVWNEKYKSYLGLDVPDDSVGVLQDIHWSHGSFGYFPTYTLGSLYAAQFFAQAQKEINNLEEQISSGNFADFLNWLRTKIHSKGRIFTSEELCKMITGEGLQSQYFIDYVKKKYKLIYNF